jgi:hypothetical protein
MPLLRRLPAPFRADRLPVAGTLFDHQRKLLNALGHTPASKSGHRLTRRLTHWSVMETLPDFIRIRLRQLAHEKPSPRRLFAVLRELAREYKVLLSGDAAKRDD